MPLNSSSDSVYLLLVHCSTSISTTLIAGTFTATRLSLLLPLSIFVVHLGYRQWQRQRLASHSDVFTYNMEVMQLISTAGWIAFSCGFFMHLSKAILAGYFLLISALPGETMFHVLTCGERYLAVVHPVAYLELKQGGGVKIRNISVACVWLLTFAWSGVVVVTFPQLPNVLLLVFLVCSLAVVTFCSIAVLCVLIRPGPRDGAGAGAGERVNQSKQRAFHTVLAITGTLWLFFAAFVASTVLSFSLLSDAELCVVLLSANWFRLPSSLVLPLLFLQRARKLTCQCFRGTRN